MNNKVSFSIADIKKAFPEYPVRHSDTSAPSRASVVLPRAMMATIDLAAGTLITFITANLDDGIKFTSADEQAALKAIEKELLPAWKAAGFEPTGERGFQNDTPGAEPEYSMTLKTNVQTMEDVKKAIHWIVEESEVEVQV